MAERVAERSFMWKRDVVEAAGATAGGAAAGAKFGGLGGACVKLTRSAWDP